MAQTHTRPDLQSTWSEYYRLRNRARFVIIGLFLALFLFITAPLPLIARVMALLDGLRPNLRMAIVVSAIGLLALIPCALLSRWIAWKCPRCGKKFAEPAPGAVIFVLVALLWKLVADSRCGSCQLECGS